MAALVNIAGLTPVEDPSYRYKMPKILGKVEGRGNGIKTVLPNIIEVSQSLNRDAPEVCKFFGTELGAQTIWSEESERAVVNGAHTDMVLQEKIRVYIEKFVLCPTCHLPETHYKIKDGVIYQKCLACGSKGACDMSHKLTTFIIAQHKKAKAEAKKAEGADKKKEKKDKKDKKDKDKDKDTTEPSESGKDKKSSKKDKERDSSKEDKKKKKEKTSVFDVEDTAGCDEVAEGDDDVKAVGKCNIIHSPSHCVLSLRPTMRKGVAPLIRALFVLEVEPSGSTCARCVHYAHI
jgi:translation initiation factor 5